MKCKILFSYKNKRNIVSLLSAEFTHNVLSVKSPQALLLDFLIISHAILYKTLNIQTDRPEHSLKNPDQMQQNAASERSLYCLPLN